MFNLVPFRNRRRREVSEGEDPFDSLVSDFFSDMMDVADIGFKTDIKEDEDNYYLEAELPGLSKDDIHLEIDKDALTIAANYEETESGNVNYIRKERRSGTCQRCFRLENVKQEEIEAEYNEGVLKVKLPKEKPGKSRKRRINIE